MNFEDHSLENIFKIFLDKFFSKIFGFIDPHRFIEIALKNSLEIFESISHGHCAVVVPATHR